MSLSKRYRPKSLEKMAGNKSTLLAVEKILDRMDENLPHAFLISGPSGTGKTTLARIIAGALDSHGMDYQELDTADFRGIDTIRSIRQQMAFRPMESKRRVWLLDECHQITKDGQEALLKALEEAPDHAFFVLATTDPDKLKPTLKRRCVHFTLSLLSEEGLLRFLAGVLASEKKEVPEEVLRQIAQDSLGSPGVALSILEKVVDLPLEKMLRVAKQTAEKQNEAIALARLLFRAKLKNWKEVAELIKTIDAEPESLRRLVLAYCSTILLGGDQPRAYVVMDSFKQPFFDDGKARLIMACYEVCNQ